MSAPIRLEPLLEENSGTPTFGSAALQLAPESVISLRFRIRAEQPDAISALLHARRSILREEWTLGCAPDEPSLGDATFSSTDVVWLVTRQQIESCLAKVAELVRRSNRTLTDLSRG